jgi:hypothetical protein
MRNKAATGQLASGGTDADLQTLAQGQANQGWQQYISNLLPFVGASTANAGTAASAAANQANLQNSNLTTQANMNYGANTAMGNAQGNADLANNQVGQNVLGILGGGFKLASGLGGFSGIGGIGGSGPSGPTSVGGAPLNSSFFG